MVTGVEAAGLALAILPLVIEAAKVYKDGVNTLAKVVSRERYDEELTDFYEDFWCETVFFHRQLKQIVRGLPGLCETCRTELHTDVAAWEENPDLERALRAYFTDDDEFATCMLSINRILEIVERLVRDKSGTGMGEKKVQQTAYDTLKVFVQGVDQNSLASTFKQRFRFSRNESRRMKHLRDLQKWNMRLKSVVDERAKTPLEIPKTSIKRNTATFETIQKYFKALTSTLSTYWQCGCATSHAARLALKAWPSDIRCDPSANFEFDLLVMSNQIGSALPVWQEGSIVYSKRYPQVHDRGRPGNLCELVADNDESCFRLLVEDSNGQHDIWQLRSVPRRLVSLDAFSHQSLQQLLASQMIKDLQAKRTLALVFAHAVLQCSGCPTLGKPFDKDKVFLLRSPDDTFDYERPYIPLILQTGLEGELSRNMSLQHRSPIILSLGILLIELHMEKPISSFRTEGECCRPTANTDLIVARRVLKKINDSSMAYKDVIRDCLEIPWVPAMEKVDLEDASTREGFYTYIISPLEKELNYLFRIQI